MERKKHETNVAHFPACHAGHYRLECPCFRRRRRTGRGGRAVAPDFGPNVLIFDPSMTTIQSRIDAVFKKQERAQFGPDRYAYLFKPGKYNLDVQVGYYMQVLGLDGRPTTSTSPARSAARRAGWAAAPREFLARWKIFRSLPRWTGISKSWAVSQATAMRRVHVKGAMNLWDGGYSSGGFIADSKIDGQVNSGSQQQWLRRNADLGKGGRSVEHGVRRHVNPPAGTWPASPTSVMEKTPVIARKAVSVYRQRRTLFCHGSQPPSGGTQGATWSGRTTPGTPCPIELFYLAHPGTGHRRQHQRRPGPREEPPVDAGHLSPGRQHPRIAAGHGRARPGIPDPGAGPREPRAWRLPT